MIRINHEMLIIIIIIIIIIAFVISKDYKSCYFHLYLWLCYVQNIEINTFQN